MNAPPTPQDNADPVEVPPALEPRLASFRLVVAVLWTLVILTLCWIPGRVVQEVEKDSTLFEVPNLDKVVHWGIFFLFAFFWLRVGSSRWRFLRVALAGIALAVVSEVVQALPVIGRDANIADGVTDLIGISLGLALAPALEPMSQRVESFLLRRWSS